MLMKISKGLTRQEIYAIGEEIGSILGDEWDEKGEKRYVYDEKEERHVVTFRNPILLRDDIRISKVRPIEKKLTIWALYNRARKTEYDEISVWHDDNKYKTVWGPTIDSILFMDSMRKHGDILTDKVEYIADGMAGGGILGIYAAEKCDNVKELCLNDINPNAMDCQRDNIKELQQKKKKLWISLSTADVRELPRKRWDLLEISTPYIPKRFLKGYSPFGGVDVLYYMIAKGKRFLRNRNGKIIITTSSLCEKFTKRALKDAKRRGLKSYEIIAEKDFPLKVMSVWNNPDWMSDLYKGGLKRSFKRGWPYWQRVTIGKLEW